MTTASPVAPDLKQVTARYRDGLQRLIHTVTTSPDLQNESSVSQFRQKTASLDDQIKKVRSRCAEIVTTKEKFQRLQRELQKHLTDVNSAKANLEALSQKVGEAAFREFLTGRLTEFPALQTRREIQRQIDELSQEKSQVDQTANAGFTDKAKQFAHSTALSGRVLLLKQKVASADKALGSAVLELKREEQVLAQEAIDIRAKVREARKAIADCEDKHTVAERHLDDCRSHAVKLGIVEVDVAHFDAEYKKCAESVLALESDRLSARWDFGQTLLSSTPEPFPQDLRQLALELNQLASKYPEECTKSAVVPSPSKKAQHLMDNSSGWFRRLCLLLPSSKQAGFIIGRHIIVLLLLLFVIAASYVALNYINPRGRLLIVVFVNDDDKSAKSYGLEAFRHAISHGGEVHVHLSDVKELLAAPNDLTYRQVFPSEVWLSKDERHVGSWNVDPRYVVLSKDHRFFPFGSMANYITSQGWKYHSDSPMAHRYVFVRDW